MKDRVWLSKRKKILLQKQELNLKLREIRREVTNLDNMLMDGAVSK